MAITIEQNLIKATVFYYAMIAALRPALLAPTAVKRSYPGGKGIA
ncbi:MAG TPA: hypothetical protein V6D14_32575 [Coleofasciculaceae cyanobacterium]